MVLIRQIDRQLSRNALIKLLSEMVGRIATFLVGLFIAHRLGEVLFGHYNYALAVGFVLSQIADLGLQLLVTREIAIHGRPVQPMVQMAFGLKCWLSVPVIALLLIGALSRPDTTKLAFLCLSLSLLAQTFLEFAAYVFRGQQQLVQEAQLLTLSRLLTALMVALLVWGGGGLTGVAVLTMLAVLATAIWGITRLGKDGWLIWPWPAPAGTRPLSLIRQALPLGIAIFLSIGYTRLAIFVLEYRLDEVAVAHYSAAQRLVEPTQIIPAAIMAAVFPAFSQAIHHDPGRAKGLGSLATLILATIGLLIAFSFWFGATTLIPFLYPAEFHDSATILRYLGLSVFPAYVNYNLTHILIARGQQIFSTLFIAAMLFLHTWLSWQLIPTWGAVAPAISVTIAEFFLLFCCSLALLFFRGNPASLV